jgi:CBS domain-containing protein
MPTVRDLMTQSPACCTPQTPINEAARMMLENDCGLIPVVDNLQDLRLVGVITDRDIVLRIVARDLDPAGAMVHQAMSEEVGTLGPDASLDQCVRLMTDRMVRRVPIVDDRGALIGIVAQADLARASTAQPELEDELAEMVEEVSEPAGAPRSG